MDIRDPCNNIVWAVHVATYPIVEDNSSVDPSASNMASLLGLLSPAMVTDVPVNVKQVHGWVIICHQPRFQLSLIIMVQIRV